MERSDIDSEYKSGAPGPPTKMKLLTEIVHKQCVTTDSRQYFKPSESQSTDNESRRGLPLRIIGEIPIEYDNNQEADEGYLTIDHAKKPRQIIGDRLNKGPKTAAERGREFRARKALLKQQCKQQQEPSEDKQVPEPSEPSAIEKKRAKSAEATRRWRAKKRGVRAKKQAKTAAERMREYRERKKFNNPSGNNEEQSDLCGYLTLKGDDITKHKKAHENFDRIFRKNPLGYSCTACDGLWLKNDLKKASHNYEDLLKKIKIQGPIVVQSAICPEEANDLSNQKEGNEITVFCPKCNTEVQHTATAIQEDQTKILIAKVYHYFECEYEELKKKYGDLDLTPLSKFSQRTAMATGVSETTVLQILKEEEERNAEKQEEEKRSRARKRSRQTESSSGEESSDDNAGDDGQPSYTQEAQNEPEFETLVVKIEPECDKDPIQMNTIQMNTIPVEIKVEPPDDDATNTNETLALTEPDPALTKRKGRKIPRRSDVTSTRQHTQGESSTAAASSSVRLTELDESGLLGGTSVKVEEIEIGDEEFR